MFRRLLVAVDGSGSTPVLVSFTASLAQHFDAHAHVLHVNPVLAGPVGHARRTNEEAAGIVEEAVTELRAAGVHATGTLCRVAVLDVPRAVAEVARIHRADAIVVGSYRRHGLSRLASAGLRERLVRSSPVPVITAPAPLSLPGRRRLRSASRGYRADVPGHSLPA